MAPPKKLTVDQELEIIGRHLAGESQRQLALHYNFCQSRISVITRKNRGDAQISAARAAAARFYEKNVRSQNQVTHPLPRRAIPAVEPPHPRPLASFCLPLAGLGLPLANPEAVQDRISRPESQVASRLVDSTIRGQLFAAGPTWQHSWQHQTQPTLTGVMQDAWCMPPPGTGGTQPAIGTSIPSSGPCWAEEEPTCPTMQHRLMDALDVNLRYRVLRRAKANGDADQLFIRLLRYGLFNIDACVGFERGLGGITTLGFDQEQVDLLLLCDAEWQFKYSLLRGFVQYALLKGFRNRSNART